MFVNRLFTKAKIGELDMASCVKEDIFWLQVAVNDPLQQHGMNFEHGRKHIQTKKLASNKKWYSESAGSPAYLHSKPKDLSVKVLKCKGDLSNIKAGSILQEYPLPLQVHEQFSPAQVLQNQIKFSLCLRKLGLTRSMHIIITWKA